MLAGDMLLSAPGSKYPTELRLPSHPKGITIPSDFSPNFVPVSMRRKIFIINDHLAVGAAGSAMHVGTFINDLQGEFGDRKEFSYEDTHGFLERYSTCEDGREVYENIGALLMIEATNRRCSLTKGLNHQLEVMSQRFGKVVAIGTGAGTIVDQIQRFDNHYKYGFAQPSDGDVQFPEFRPLAANLMLLANIYWKEFMSPDNLFEAWGGAYDVIYQDSNRIFRFLEDYTIFLRVFDVEDPEQGVQLLNVLKYERRRDFSFVLMLHGDGPRVFGAKDIAASDRPMEIALNREDFKMDSTKTHISIIAVRNGDIWLAPMIQIDGIDPTGTVKPTVFTWIDDEGRLRVGFHAAHDEWLEQQAMSYYQRHVDRKR